VLERLAVLVHSLNFGGLPREVVSAAKARILDTLGCAYGALDTDVSRAAARKASADSPLTVQDSP